MKIFVPFVAASMAIAGVASDAKHTSRQLIVGGEETFEGNHPFVVSLRLKKPDETLCHGALISPNVVLTTIFCGLTEPEHYRLNYATIGAYYSRGMLNAEGDRDGEHLKILKTINHPDFEHPTNSVDIAVLILEKESTFKPIGLPTSSEIDLKTPLRTFGWGSTYYATESEADQSFRMKTILLNPMTQNECSKAYENITNSFFCASGENQGGLCIGDNGNPAIDEKKEVVVGISSHGKGCNNNVLSNVGAVTEWLQEIIKQYAPKQSQVK
ncbi:hypothetical protein CCR75_003925 [Bremia lactucae]|uniref:Peptidase S1 domain-containing protein n=1 Tax=Bremia lactucae TaxID=4779 RepID=A0A976FHY7_BRELC|nr:hypothetical protein CCR75_003925 [Bremia lactucae]